MIKIHLENEEEVCRKHYLSCKDAILDRIELKLDDSDISDFHNLLNFIKRRLEDILTKKPDGLVTINKDFIRQFSSILKPKKNNPQTYELIDEILDYISFSSKAKNSSKWDVYKLAIVLNVSVCPYCNRIYTNTVITENQEKIVRPDFDHFFPKALYPLFQMSFYNLIPSCTICNSRLKGNRYVNPKKLNEYIHPYLKGFGNDGRFTFTLILKNKIKDIYCNENLRIKIRKGKSQVINNCKIFKIEDVYQAHTDVVSEMINKFTIYNDIYVEFLKSFNSIGLSKGEIYKIAFGNFYEPKDFQKRPLSKLTRDIYDEIVGETSGITIQLTDT